MKARDYIDSKLQHLKRIGMAASLNPATGGVTLDWIVAEREEREKMILRKAKRNKERYREDLEVLDRRLTIPTPLSLQDLSQEYPA
jgi:DNA segregation ATPase FtsK/SpoIIIE-like protein